MATKTVFITSSGDWSVPADFASLVSIDAIGPGGGGAAARSNQGQAGAGGGGAWASIASLSLTPNQLCKVQVGLGGLGGIDDGGTANPGASGSGDTWFSTTTVAPTSTSQGVLAKFGVGGGQGGYTTNPGAGGSAAASIGSSKNDGGAGGEATDTTYGGVGGGGAGGSHGAGKAGAQDSGTAGTATGGAGGGAADNGGVGQTTQSTHNGGAGGAAQDSTAGGTGGTGASGAGTPTAGGPGSHGSGGGGGGGHYGSSGSAAGGAGGRGGDGIGYTSTIDSAVAGPGGGGGGGGGNSYGAGKGGAGGHGGQYGGGGGSAGADSNDTGTLYVQGGDGGDGVIIFTYNVAPPLPVRDWYAAEGLAEQTTTSNSVWTTQCSLTFTPKANTAYVIFWSGSLAVTVTTPQGHKAQADLYDVTNATELGQTAMLGVVTTDYPSVGHQYFLAADANPVSRTFSIRFKSEASGDTTKMKSARLVALELTADDVTVEDLTESSDATDVHALAYASWPLKLTANITVPTGGGDYLIIPSYLLGNDSAANSMGSMAISLLDDAAVFYDGADSHYSECPVTEFNPTDRFTLPEVWKRTLTAGAHTVKIRYGAYATGGRTARIKEVRVLFLRLDKGFGENFYSELTNSLENVSRTTTYGDVCTTGAQTYSGGNYLVLGWGNYLIDSGPADQGYQQVVSNSVSLWESTRANYAALNGFNKCWGGAVQTIPAGSRTLALQQKNKNATLAAGGWGSVIAIQLPPRSPRDVQYAEGLAEQSTTSATVWTTQAALTFTPKADTDYAILWSGSLYLGSTTSDGQADFYDMPNAQELVLQNIEGLGTSPVDYVGVGGLYGLIGHSAGNVLTSAAQNFTSGWTPAWSTLTANNVTAPDGTTTAAKLIEDNSAGQNHEIQVNLSKAASAIMYWGSIWVKRQAGTRSVLLSFDNSTHSNYVQVAFNLAVGTASQLSINNFTLHEMFVDTHADGWFHVGARFTTDTDTALNWYVSATNNANPPTTPYNGDGSSGLALWHPRIALAKDGPRRTGSTMIRSPDLLGNLTEGGGLAALFNGVIIEYDYQAPYGALLSNGTTGVPYGGLSIKTKVASVRCWSTNDGFVSVNLTNVSLELRAKTGAAPANAADGTLLGTTGPFTDVTTSYQDVTSNDTDTVWDHIWVRLLWTDGQPHSISFAEMAFYAPAEQRSLAVRFKSETGGVTTKMKDARLVALELTSDDVYGEKPERQTQTTGLLDALATNITVPTGGGDYLVAASCHVDISNIANLVGWACFLNATGIDENPIFSRNSGANWANYLSARDTTNRTPWVQFVKKTLDAGVRYLTQAVDTDTGITEGIEQARTLFLRLDDGRFGENFYTEIIDSSETAFGSENYSDAIGIYYDSTCKLLLHMNGADEGTTFVDSSPYSRTITRGGNAKTDSAQSKFGGTSAYFDGAGDYLQWPQSPELKYGSSEFTIQGWVRFESVAAGGGLVLANVNQSTQYTPILIARDTAGLWFYISTSGTAWNNTASYYKSGLTTNVWYHFACVRKGDTLYEFFDGQLLQSYNLGAGFSFPQGNDYWRVGYHWDNTDPFQGWIDELSIEIGVGRWTAAFAPPTAPLSPAPTFSGGDYLLLGHCNYTISDTTHSEYAKVLLDATTLIEQNAESGPYQDVECSTAFVAAKAALSAGSHTLKVQKKNSTGGGWEGTLGVGAVLAIKIPSAEEGPEAPLIDLILSDAVLDSGLAELADATLLHVLSQQPTTYAEVATYTLGSGSVTVGAPGAVTGGRKVTVPQVSGTTTDAGDAIAWALVDGSRLLATGKLSELVEVGDAAAFDVATFDIQVPRG